MPSLTRILLLALCAALIVTSYATYWSTTMIVHAHDTFYTQVRPSTSEVRQWSLFAVLALSFLLVRSDPLFARIGLLAVVAALAMMLVPPREVHHTLVKLGDMKFEPEK